MSKPFFIPLSIILAGIFFSIYLQWQVPDGVYFSGDAGLKALLARQLADGIFQIDLAPPAESWARNLWEQGLYPYEKPYVYEVANKYYITFPFTFPLITAPFEAIFGYRGLYLVPLVSTWIIWLVFSGICQKLNFNNLETSIALISLIFASPITIYSAMYWEHTLAVALAFTGTAMLVVSKKSSELSVKTAVISGGLIGLSVWFRPEFLCWVGLLTCLVYLTAFVRINALDFLAKNKTIFVASMLGAIALFFFCNQVIYGHFLGVHAIQVVEEYSLIQKLRDSRKSFQQLGFAFFEYFPVALFLLLAPVLSFIQTKKFKFTLSLFLPYIFCFLFIIGVALMVPPGKQGLIPGGKQWGARFLLILIPFVAIAVTQTFSQLRGTIKSVGIFLISIFLIWGIQKNTYQATVYLQKNYQGIFPAIQFLQDSPHRIVAISHQYVGQAMEASLSRDKLFFLVEDGKDLEKLSLALLEQKQDKFIYICYPHRPCNLPEETSENLKIYQKRNLNIKFSSLGNFGKYPIYKGALSRYN